MIIDRPESWYIFVYNTHDYESSDDPGAYIAYDGWRLTNREYLEHWGKWIFFGEKEELDEMARKLDPFVENGQIPCIKYDRAPQRWFDLEQCVMCVYCDDRQRDEVFQILSRFGVKEQAWVYDQEVIQKWMPGGLFLESWLKYHNVTEEEAEKIREDARKRFQRQFFERPDDVCFALSQ